MSTADPSDILMFVIDVLRYDLATLPDILSLINESGDIGWRFTRNEAFSEQEVLDALDRLLRLGMIERLREDDGSRAMIVVDSSKGTNLRRQSWYGLTPAGQLAWDNWNDPPIKP